MLRWWHSLQVAAVDFVAFAAAVVVAVEAAVGVGSTFVVVLAAMGLTFVVVVQPGGCC